jgi:transcriptional regulator with XRE-family HTH domain
MKPGKRKRLEAAGWRFGSADEFLGLSAVESVLVDLRLAVSRALRVRRVRLHLSQRDLARRIESSQSRVAKMEAADPAVSIDLLVRALLATGATRRDLSKAIEAPTTPRTLLVRERRMRVRSRRAAPVAALTPQVPQARRSYASR